MTRLKQGKGLPRTAMKRGTGFKRKRPVYPAVEAPKRKPWPKERGRKRINARSKRTADWYREVRVPAVREAVGDGFRPCVIQAPVCTWYVQGLHEPLTRARAGSAQMAHEAGTVPCCHACNGYVSEHPLWGLEHGWLQKAAS